MRISIIGTGYVGLVSGVCLANKGHKVICVDVRNDVVENLNMGKPHIYENDLQNLLNNVLEKNLFHCTTNLNYALDESDIVLLAVGTPSENGKIDLSQIEYAATQIGEYIKIHDKFISVVVKSTVIPTTSDTFVKDIIEKSSNKSLGDFGIGMNPEFLREGDAVQDFMFPDRVVIGFEDERTKNLLDEMYSPWECDKLFVNTRTAEMIKYANNTLLACQISMNNELSNLAYNIGGIDYMDVIDGVSMDKRWSPILEGKRIKPSILSYFTPGAGFGGSCFPKDVQAIRTQGEMNNLDMLMTNSILSVNENQPNQVLDMLNKLELQINNILLLGLAFKPETDDIRESSSIKILKLLLDHPYNVIAHDPIAIENTKKEISSSNLEYVDDWKSEVTNADVIIVSTNWKEYNFLEQILLKTSKTKIILDCKRLFSSFNVNQHKYLTFGKNKIK